MSKDVPLTVLDQQFQAMVKETPSGMAYWAGTGPQGRTCRECVMYKADGYNASNLLKPAKCRKYTELSHREGKSFPHDSKACKYFEANESPPPAFKLKMIGM